ncbi:MAG: type IX secretion system membrane protein PorP/SprF [Crocinitomicaceae bacterium]|nr:type IX secretion system membrane protein PorP/SprF [Crocinitomicaceae bacterium]
MGNFKITVSIITLGLSSSLFGQQDIQFTQYFDNMLAVNPAYAGSNKALNATAIHREQWVGMEGRPRSTTFSLHSPLSYENIGLGFTAVNDIVGPIQQTAFYGDFSYTLNFKKSRGKLSLGIKGGINLLNSRTDLLNTIDVNDPHLMTNVQNQINPNFGGGIYYHTPDFFMGISAPKIIEKGFGSSTTARERRHYFFTAGGVLNLSKNQIWKLRPTTMVKYTSGAPLALDLSAAAIYNETLWIGLSHRWGDSFGGFVQYQVSNQFKVGIAYDQTVTEFSGFNKGTYEALLSYDFVFKKAGIISPRFF